MTSNYALQRTAPCRADGFQPTVRRASQSLNLVVGHMRKRVLIPCHAAGALMEIAGAFTLGHTRVRMLASTTLFTLTHTIISRGEFLFEWPEVLLC